MKAEFKIAGILITVLFLFWVPVRADHRPLEVVATVPVASVKSLDFHPLTSHVYAAGGALLVIDANTNRVVAAPRAPGTWLAVDPLANRVYVTAHDHVWAVDSFSHSVVARIPLSPENVASVKVDPIDNRVFAVHWGREIVSIIDGLSNTVDAQVRVGRGSRWIDLNPFTGTAYVPNVDDGTISVIRDRRVVATIPVPAWERWPSGVTVNPFTNRVYVQAINGIVVIDGATNSMEDWIYVWGSPSGAPGTDFVLDRLYVTTHRNVLEVYDTTTNRLLERIPVGIDPCTPLVDPVRHRVYVPNGGSDTITVVDGLSMSAVATLEVGGPLCLTGQDAVVDLLTDRVYFRGSASSLAVIDGFHPISGDVIADLRDLSRQLRDVDLELAAPLEGAVRCLEDAGPGDQREAARLLMDFLSAVDEWKHLEGAEEWTTRVRISLLLLIGD